MLWIMSSKQLSETLINTPDNNFETACWLAQPHDRISLNTAIKNKRRNHRTYIQHNTSQKTWTTWNTWKWWIVWQARKTWNGEQSTHMDKHSTIMRTKFHHKWFGIITENVWNKWDTFVARSHHPKRWLPCWLIRYKQTCARHIFNIFLGVQSIQTYPLQ